MTPGDALEDAVKQAAEWYEAQNIALVNKVPTPIKVLSGVRKTVRGREFTACFEAPAVCDFLGVFLSAAGDALVGKILAVECKSTVALRLPYSAVEPQQRRWLNAIQHAYLLVEFRHGAKSACRLVAWRLCKPGQSVGPQDGVSVDAVQFLSPVLSPSVNPLPGDDK